MNQRCSGVPIAPTARRPAPALTCGARPANLAFQSGISGHSSTKVQASVDGDPNRLGVLWAGGYSIAELWGPQRAGLHGTRRQSRLPMVCCGASSASWSIKSARAPATVTCASACGPATGSPSENLEPKGVAARALPRAEDQGRESSGARFSALSVTGRSNIPACGSSTLNSMLIRSCSSVVQVNHHRGLSGRISSHFFASGENAAAMFARLRSHEARNGAHCRHRDAADRVAASPISTLPCRRCFASPA